MSNSLTKAAKHQSNDVIEFLLWGKVIHDGINQDYNYSVVYNLYLKQLIMYSEAYKLSPKRNTCPGFKTFFDWHVSNQLHDINF